MRFGALWLTATKIAFICKNVTNKQKQNILNTLALNEKLIDILHLHWYQTHWYNPIARNTLVNEEQLQERLLG